VNALYDVEADAQFLSIRFIENLGIGKKVCVVSVTEGSIPQSCVCIQAGRLLGGPEIMVKR
jgi:hypothetical protein